MKQLQIACSGYSINADWYDGKLPDQILLTLSGWPSTREQQRPLVEKLVQETGVCALVPEYSGSGDSTFDPDDTRPAQHFLEVICVFDWLRSTYPEAHISVLGSSYGGYLATQLTKYRTFNNLILRVPAIYQPSDFYTRAADMDRDWTVQVFRKDTAALARHPLLARASGFTGKTLVVIHDADERVPKETTDAYTKAFSADSYVAKGFGHSFNPSLPAADIQAYHTAIANWLQTHLA